MKYYSLIVFLSVFCLNAKSQSPSKILITEGFYKFYLNENQILSSSHLEFDDKSNELWRSVSFPKGVIEVFDASSGRLKNKIDFKENLIGVFKRLPDGRIWVRGPQKYFLITNSGKILKTIEEPLLGTKGEIDILTSYSSGTPIITFKENLFVTGQIFLFPGLNTKSESYNKRGVVRLINTNGSISYIGLAASNSLKFYYGALNSYCSTEKKNKLIIAPFFNNQIQEIDLESFKIKFYSTKTKFDDFIKPMSSLEDYSKFTNGQANDYFTNNYALIGLVYDKYRNIYYRFIKHPGPKIPIKCTIAVMNAEFKVLFYYDLPEIYDPARFFINKQGLFFPNLNKYKLNQNILFFDLFKAV